MDIFCLSSSKEGFPNVVCEAMAMNIPCVVTDAGDSTEIVSDTGMVVSTCDPIALAGALQTMISKDIVERSQLGERARLRIEKYYSIDIASARFENVYNKVIKNIPLGVRRK
jgi:glycosyltransferase involved in cell wall biosynthesis